ncbi:MAG: GTP cyclohydrolase FolE2 [Spirochaetes bacterium]|nr:GTP cyclohydrolase FolE2 [Spirochaetota bacterium]
MIDVQSFRDDRRIRIQKVGVKGLRYPITVLDKTNEVQHTTAIVNLFADLPHDFKGTHMSRFIEVFDAHRQDLGMRKFLAMLDEIRSVLDAETAYADVHFPYFIEKAAPASGAKSIMSYDCGYSGRVSAALREFDMLVSVPVQTVCPCSLAISRNGGHNQRGLVTIRAAVKRFVWIEDIVAAAEECASAGLYTLLKREDEKAVTERAFDNPRFVEDVVRETYKAIRAMDAFPRFSVDAENFESIHNHSAYAYVEYPDTEVPGAGPSS